MGMGFLLSHEEASELITRDARNKKVVVPYLIGDDIFSHPTQAPSRWVINFRDWSLEESQSYPDCMRIVEERVRPERLAQKDKQGREYWWRFLRTRPELYRTIQHRNRVLVVPWVGKFITFTFQRLDIVWGHPLIVFSIDDWQQFGLLQSTIHEIWVRDKGSTLETRSRYTPTDCYETFAYPSEITTIAASGEAYYAFRDRVLSARNDGLTKTYNCFHDPDETSADIQKLRQLHVEMDNIVAAAYGWTDLDLGHGFHKTKQGVRYTISEPARCEVLARLLKLNHERYAEEVKQGLHEKKKGSAKKTTTKKTDAKPVKDTATLFDMHEDDE
jgi:hypothetical protein